MPDVGTTGLKRVLSGMRPTGKIHLGNYMGALHNWVRLQNQHDYDCYFFIADWHALTTDYADPSQIPANTREVILDYLAAGLDPEKSVLFVQSHIPQHAELHLLLSMITSIGWLERVPSYKEQQENIKDKDLSTYGFLGYPLLQAADILMYRPAFVPVGQDQVAHVELTREVARRFNFFYGPGSPRRSRFEGPEAFHPLLRQQVENELAKRGEEFKGAYFQDFPPNDLAALIDDKILPEPEALLTPSPKLPGTDGRKMSKSYGNTIMLTDSYKTVSTKLKNMDKGGQRTQLNDPGDPDKCPVGDLHKVFSTSETLQEILSGCRNASIPCLECKQFAADSIWKELRPIQARRSEFELDPHRVDAILAEGAARARITAEATMQEVRKAMGLAGTGQFQLTAFEQIQQNNPKAILHDLSNHKEWWDLGHDDRSNKLRDYWRNRMIPSDTQLKASDRGLFITGRNKRVFVPTARERQLGEYKFNLRNKSYEALVLLAWDKNFKLRAFAIPQKEYREAWSKIHKSVTRFDIELRAHEDHYLLSFPDSQPIDVTRYEGDFSPLR